ncbi:MAG: alpha/beta fold hydrolase [Nitrospirota bacterium]|nr:alpha/beta fold hydrolase [Nitrospirota bacterium]
MNMLIGIVVLVIALSLVLVFANTHPPRYPLHIPPSQYNVAYEDVSFVTSDNVSLKGWLIKPDKTREPAPAIIICHGLGANRSDFTDLAVSLIQRGYLVLTFDFRAHGESGGGRSSLGLNEQKDVAAALAYLHSRKEIDPKRIGIYGFSLGGATAILAAENSGGFRAVVTDSAFTSLRDQARTAITGFYHLPAFPFLSLTTLGYRLYFFAPVDGVDPEKVIAKLSPVPVLIIAGEGDDLIPVENGKRLFAAAREPKEQWIIQNALHGGTMAAAGPEYQKRVGEFFDRYLKY